MQEQYRKQILKIKQLSTLFLVWTHGIEYLKPYLNTLEDSYFKRILLLFFDQVYYLGFLFNFSAALRTRYQKFAFPLWYIENRIAAFASEIECSVAIFPSLIG